MISDIQTNLGYTNWASKFKNELKSTGFNHVWLNQDVENTKYCIHIFQNYLSYVYANMERRAK